MESRSAKVGCVMTGLLVFFTLDGLQAILGIIITLPHIKEGFVINSCVLDIKLVHQDESIQH